MRGENAFWADLDSSKANWNGDGISTGFSSGRTQFSLGVDVVSHRDSRVGFGMTHSYTDVNADKGTGSVDEAMGFLYGQLAYERYLIDGLVGFGTSKTVSQRSDPTGLTNVLSSSQNGSNSLVSVGMRTSIDFDGNALEPFARVMWQQNGRDGFSEGTAVAALSFANYSASGVRSLVGLSGSSISKDPFASSITYQFSAAVGQDSGDLVRPSVQATLAGVNTTISSPDIGRTFLQANASFTSRIDRQAYAYAGITGESFTGKSDLGINFGMRVKF